jgi:hypothetical protein
LMSRDQSDASRVRKLTFTTESADGDER